MILCLPVSIEFLQTKEFKIEFIGNCGLHMTDGGSNFYWDAVFNPQYEILDIENQNGSVKATVSKMDKRISFPHEKPLSPINY